MRMNKKKKKYRPFGLIGSSLIIVHSLLYLVCRCDLSLIECDFLKIFKFIFLGTNKILLSLSPRHDWREHASGIGCTRNMAAPQIYSQMQFC